MKHVRNQPKSFLSNLRNALNWFGSSPSDGASGRQSGDWNRSKLSIEPLEDRRMLSVIHWDGGASGTGTDWSVAENWQGDQLPTAADDVVIDTTNGLTITHSSGTDSVNSITSTNALMLSRGTLAVSGAIQVNNIFTIAGGTLADATILAGSGGQDVTFTSSGGDIGRGNGKMRSRFNDEQCLCVHPQRPDVERRHDLSGRYGEHNERPDLLLEQ